MQVKVVMVRKHGLDLYLILVGVNIVASYWSERYATMKASILNSKMGN